MKSCKTQVIETGLFMWSLNPGQFLLSLALLNGTLVADVYLARSHSKYCSFQQIIPHYSWHVVLPHYNRI